MYVYQGDELGLPEVQDLPDALLQDPTFVRSGGTDRGRDGCRVPLPWATTGTSLGFSVGDAEVGATEAGNPQVGAVRAGGAAAPWLPQPADWSALSVAAQEADPDSVLALYRAGLALRRELLVELPESLTWVDAGPDVLVLDRGEGFRCVVNLGERPYELPAGATVLLASGELTDGAVPQDTTVWLTR